MLLLYSSMQQTVADRALFLVLKWDTISISVALIENVMRVTVTESWVPKNWEPVRSQSGHGQSAKWNLLGFLRFFSNWRIDVKLGLFGDVFSKIVYHFFLEWRIHSLFISLFMQMEIHSRIFIIIFGKNHNLNCFVVSFLRVCCFYDRNFFAKYWPFLLRLLFTHRKILSKLYLDSKWILRFY